MDLYKIISYLFKLIMVIGTIFVVIFSFQINKLFAYLMVFVSILFPYLLNKTKYKLNNREIFFYTSFIFLSLFLGFVLNFYNAIWWYDILVHFLSGIFVFEIGLSILRKLGIKSNFYFKIFFCIILVMGVSGLWEIFEFSVDQAFKVDMQNAICTGVIDTMEDMIMSIIGGLIYCEYLIIKLKSL